MASEQTVSEPSLKYAARVFGPGLPEGGKAVDAFVASDDNAAVDYVRMMHLEATLPPELEEIDLPDFSIDPVKAHAEERSIHAAIDGHLEMLGSDAERVRAHLEGGKFSVEVEALDKSLHAVRQGDKTVMIEGPAGVVSRFEVEAQPHPHLARKVRERRQKNFEAHLAAAKHDAVLDELVADGTVIEEQVASKRRLPPEVRASHRKEREARVAGHRERIADAVKALVAEGDIDEKHADAALAWVAPALKESGK